MSKRFNNYEEDDHEGKSSSRSGSGKKGKWTEDEDELLRDGINELGKQWTEIARRIKGRTGHDCLLRWEKYIRPDLIKDPWSSEVIKQ